MGLWDIAKGAIYNMITSPTRKEIDKLISVVGHYRLVGWDAHELDQLSRGQDKVKIKRLPKGIRHGVYQSIYHESLVSYAVKSFSDKSRQLIVVRINNDHFAFQSKGNRGSFDSDMGLSGKYDVGAGLSFYHNKLQVYIDTESQGDLSEVSVNGTSICYINKQKDDSLTHLRVVRSTNKHDPKLDKLIQLAVVFGLVDNRL